VKEGNIERKMIRKIVSRLRISRQQLAFEKVLLVMHLTLALTSVKMEELNEKK